MSNVDPTVPTTGIAFTNDIRNNFAVIKQELEVIQAFLSQRSATDSPLFTGTAQLVHGNMSGNLTIAGTFTPTVEAYTLQQVPNLTAAGNCNTLSADGTLGGLKFSKNATGNIVLSGAVTVTFSAVNAAGQIVAPGGVDSRLYNANQNIAIPITDGRWCMYLILTTTGAVQIGFNGNTGPTPPYTTLVFFSGSYRIAP